MSPSERRDVCEEVCWRVQPGFFPLRDSDTKLLCIPEDDDGGEQVQTCTTEVLAFRGAVADFALATDPQGTFQSMVCLTFIEANMAGLNLLAAIVIYWNAKHLGHAVALRRRAGLDCQPNLLAHISPLGWAHVLLTGEYRWRKP